jgi:hypothetical protein
MQRRKEPAVISVAVIQAALDAAEREVAAAAPPGTRPPVRLEDATALLLSFRGSSPGLRLELGDGVCIAVAVREWLWRGDLRGYLSPRVLRDCNAAAGPPPKRRGARRRVAVEANAHRHEM